MADDETPVPGGRPPTAFQRWVRSVLEPFPPAVQITLVAIVCVVLVLLPLLLLVLGSR